MQPTPATVLSLADSAGWEVCATKERADRSGDGQFFTPAPIASHLASWFSEKSLNQPVLHVLDPGAGGGVLTAAFVDRIITLREAGRLPLLKELHIEAWEADEAFIPTLTANIDACTKALSALRIRTTSHIHHTSYIDGAVHALDTGLFGKREESTITHAILNPPYRKIANRSQERALLASIGIETTNLYAAFVWLALRQLADGGELAAITPRSFCNGPYFRDFRRELIDESQFTRVHLFDSRTEAFGRDEVLQENVLFHLTRRKGECDAITLSTGSLESSVLTRVPANRFVRDEDPEKIIHIATDTDADEVRDFIESLPCTLEQLGLEVSTGPVVDFRLKASLSQSLGPSDVPLLYPHCIKPGRVTPPFSHSTDYDDTRIAKKPVAITVNDDTRRWLVPAARFVLIKRFTSKEEKRRLVAGVLDPIDFPEGPLGLENHLNFFHSNRRGLSTALARGLCRFLNSTVADRYFRQFNGHTQVNATDLRAFRYPDAKALEKLGTARINDTHPAAIDLAMTQLLGAPSFPSP